MLNGSARKEDLIYAGEHSERLDVFIHHSQPAHQSKVLSERTSG